MHSKVMKVYTKSLKNVTEQSDKVIQACLNACIKFKCLLITLINPLTTAHFAIKMNIH